MATLNITTQCGAEGFKLAFENIKVKPRHSYTAYIEKIKALPKRTRVFINPTVVNIKADKDVIDIFSYARLISLRTADNSCNVVFKLVLKDNTTNTIHTERYLTVICGDLCSASGTPLTSDVPTATPSPTPSFTPTPTPTVTVTPSNTPATCGITKNSISLVNGGSNYEINDKFTVTDNRVSNEATLIVTSIGSSGNILDFDVCNPGSAFQQTPVVKPQDFVVGIDAQFLGNTDFFICPPTSGDTCPKPGDKVTKTAVADTDKDAEDKAD